MIEFPETAVADWDAATRAADERYPALQAEARAVLVNTSPSQRTREDKALLKSAAYARVNRERDHVADLLDALDTEGVLSTLSAGERVGVLLEAHKAARGALSAPERPPADSPAVPDSHHAGLDGASVLAALDEVLADE